MSKLSLWGYMGAGKSTVGKLLASQIGFSFYDLDQTIEQSYGAIGSIFKNHGEIAFRKLERNVLEKTLFKNENIVLGSGGGTPIFYDNASLMNQESISIYLQADPIFLSERLFKERAKRPLIAHLNSQEELQEFVAKHLFERNPFYMKATHRINVKDKTPQLLCEQITELINL